MAQRAAALPRRKRTVIAVPVREERDAADGEDAQEQRLTREKIEAEGDEGDVQVDERVHQVHAQAAQRAVVRVVRVHWPLRHARMLLRRLFGVAHGARAAPHSARPGAEQWLDGGAG